MFQLYSATKECDDAMADPSGRWFPFVVTDQTMVIMESKNCPEHVRGIDNMDKPVTLVSMMSDLEDNGEVAWNQHVAFPRGYVTFCGSS